MADWTQLTNRVVQTTTTTGTGTLDLVASGAGYRDFLDDASSGDEVFFVITDSATDPTFYEVVRGTITSGTPDTLSRDVVIGSSNAGVKVSLAAGTKLVIGSPAKEMMDRLKHAIFGVQSADPTTAANQVSAFAKDVGGVARFHWGAESAGTSYVVSAMLSTQETFSADASKTVTNIVPGASQVTITLANISLSGTNSILIRIGDSGGVESTGYVMRTFRLVDSGAIGGVASTAEWRLNTTLATAANLHGSLILTRRTGNEWNGTGTFFDDNGTDYMFITTGSKTLSGELDRVFVGASAGTISSGTLSVTTWT